MKINDAEVLFDGSASSDVDHFLFYFEDIAEVESAGEEKARAVIIDLRGEAFKFYFRRFTKQDQLMEEAKIYDAVRAIFRKKYERKRDASTGIENAVLLQMRQHESLLQFF